MIYIYIEIPADELARLFCESTDVEQAKFFNAIAKEVEGWPFPFPFQMASVERNGLLTDEARQVMRDIGEFGNKQVK